MTKIQKIREMGFGLELWNRDDLRNPCSSGWVAYYMATQYDANLSDSDNASLYYKIASMHDDIPDISRILGIMSLSQKKNYSQTALTFSLIASAGYDEEPYSCRELGYQLSNDLSEKVSWTRSWIDLLESRENLLKNPANPTNPLSLRGTCYESLEQGIKQIYLGYITEQTKNFPEIVTGDDIRDAGIMTHIPTLHSQRQFDVKKINGAWQYRRAEK